MTTDYLVGDGTLFEPDAMLPTQFFGRLRTRVPQEPEVALVMAILEDAVHCYQKYRFATDGAGIEQFEDARDWFAESDRKWPFSFENICGVLKLDADYVRDGLRAWEETARRLRETVVTLPQSQDAAVEALAG